jgi:hypothetical protein
MHVEKDKIIDLLIRSGRRTTDERRTMGLIYYTNLLMVSNPSKN